MRGFTDETTPHQLVFESFGVSVNVCASSPEVLEKIERLMPPNRIPRDERLTAHRLGIVTEDDGTYSVYNSGTRVSEGAGLELALVVIEGQVRSYISVNAPEFVFVHVGAVAHEGRGILIPGQSFSGKTTLTAALVRAGAEYYSDEFGVLDREGRLHPYMKPLSLRPDGVQIEHPVEKIGGVAGEEPVPVSLVLSTFYKPGADWAPERLDSGPAALELMSNTVTMMKRPEDAMKTVTRLLASAVFLKGERGEADEVAPRLLEQAVQLSPL